jgi:uncharacterized C2H2 Zn-finger protein
MKQTTREFIRRHAEMVSVGVFVSVAVLAAFVAVLFHRVNKQGVQLGAAVLCVAFAAFFTWARTSLPRIEPKGPVRVATIKEHFRRTRTLSVRIIVPVVALWAVLADSYPLHLSKSERNTLVIGGGAVLGVVGSLLTVRRLRCPRCGTNFKKERFAKLGRWSFNTRGTEEIWDACPHCGVSFDEPWR